MFPGLPSVESLRWPIDCDCLPVVARRSRLEGLVSRVIRVLGRSEREQSLTAKPYRRGTVTCALDIGLEDGSTDTFRIVWCCKSLPSLVGACACHLHLLVPQPGLDGFQTRCWWSVWQRQSLDRHLASHLFEALPRLLSQLVDQEFFRPLHRLCFLELLAVFLPKLEKVPALRPSSGNMFWAKNSLISSRASSGKMPATY